MLYTFSVSYDVQKVGGETAEEDSGPVAHLVFDFKFNVILTMF